MDRRIALIWAVAALAVTGGPSARAEEVSASTGVQARTPAVVMRAANDLPRRAMQDVVGDLDGDGKVTFLCIGDSNTDTDPAFSDGETWCEQLGTLFKKPEWVTLNRGLGGSTAVRSSRTAFTQLPEGLKAGNIDVVLMAYGTNDLWYDYTPLQTIAAYREVKLLAGARPVFIALTPPRYDLPEYNPKIAELNRLLLADRTFAGVFGFTPDLVASEDYMPDRLHLNSKGHAKRAAAARAVLER